MGLTVLVVARDFVNCVVSLGTSVFAEENPSDQLSVFKRGMDEC